MRVTPGGREQGVAVNVCGRSAAAQTQADSPPWRFCQPRPVSLLCTCAEEFAEVRPSFVEGVRISDWTDRQ